MTILNCIRVLRGGVMECAASVAPTGCAASLSKGRTSHRFFKFPAGNSINAQPYHSNTSKIADAQAFLNQMEAMEALVALVLDKVSTKGRKHFAWEDHRFREGRKHILSNTDRTWGGIPVRFAFGDVQQLPMLLPAKPFTTVIQPPSRLPHLHAGAMQWLIILILLQERTMKSSLLSWTR
jgi:hypothetical protein